jgi:hypothetical protein
VKQKLPVLRIEAHDIGRQHIDGEIRRELRNALAVLPAFHYRDRTPAFLNLEFHDELAARAAAAHMPDAHATSALCKQDAVAGPNVAKSGSHNLRVST